MSSFLHQLCTRAIMIVVARMVGGGRGRIGRPTAVDRLLSEQTNKIKSNRRERPG